MLSIQRIQRLIGRRQFDTLLGELALNGTILPLAVRARIAGNETAVAALALRRVAELAYGPVPAVEDLAERIVRADATEAEVNDDPIVAALAAAALGRAIDAAIPATGFDCDDDLFAARDTNDELALACACDTSIAGLTRIREQALTGLVNMQEDDGLFFAADDRDNASRTLTAAFIAYLLADDADFRATIRFADLMTALEERRDGMDDATRSLFEVAALYAPANRQPHRPRSTAGTAQAA